MEENAVEDPVSVGFRVGVRPNSAEQQDVVSPEEAVVVGVVVVGRVRRVGRLRRSRSLRRLRTHRVAVGPIFPRVR